MAGVDLPVPREQFRHGVLKNAIPAIVDPAFGPDWRGLTVEYKLAGEVHTSGTIEPRLQPGDLSRVGGALELQPRDGRSPDREPLESDRRDRDPRATDRATTVACSGDAADVGGVATAASRYGGAVVTTRIKYGPRAGGVRLYHTDPYSDYEESERRGSGQNQVPRSDTDRHPKEQALGVTVDGVAKAYPRAVVADEGAVNDAVNGLPVVVTTTSNQSTLVAYDRTVGGERLSFERTGGQSLAARGARWNLTTGERVTDSEDGTHLTRPTAQSQLFWFAWLDFHPETGVYRG